MPSHDDIARRWIEVLAGDTYPSSGRPKVNLAGSSMYGAGPVLYSYGTHFPLAEYYPAGEHGRDRALFLLNGDRVSNTTSRHQSATRGAVGDGSRFGADVLLVPFSALDGARIARRTIRPLDIRPDRWTETLEPIGELDLDATAGATCSRDETGYSGDVRRIHTWRLADGRRLERSETLERCSVAYYGPDGERLAEPRRTLETFEPGTKLGTPYLCTASGGHGSECRLEPDGRWYAVHRRHWLGDSVFMASVQGTRRRRRPVSVADVVSAALADISADSFAGRNGRDRAPILRALTALDTSAPIVETAPVQRRRRFISSFDTGEPAPLYYLATLPGSSRARTVADAEMDLAPAAVHAAMARGRDVRRQGDTFYIETSLTAGELEGITRARARLTQWTRGARARAGEIGYVAPLDTAGRARMATWRRRRFGETFEVGTFGPVTPRGTRATMRRKRTETLEQIRRLNERLRSEILAGDYRRAVSTRDHLDGRYGARAKLAALELERTAHRDSYRRRHVLGGGYALELYGDVLAATMDRFEPGRRPLSDRWTRDRARIAETLAVHGTAHTATEVVRATFGRVYVRGTVRHVPALAGETWRRRDHVNVKLGDGETWYLAVRNTVPRNRDGR